MKATLNPDHTASVSYKGEVTATPKWGYYSGMVSFDGDVANGASLYGESKDGKFIITYSGEDYYKFTMEPSKQASGSLSICQGEDKRALGN